MHDLDRQQLEQYEHEGLLGEYAIGELTEAQEMELAAKFLEITSEEELEEFLGNLLRRARMTIGRAYNSPFFQQKVIPALKTAATYFGPLAGGAGAGVSPGADQTAMVGAPALADQLLSAELEGLSGEDREFELARRYIRFAIEALQRALQVPPRVPKPVAAEIAVGEAARTHVPGLVPFVPQLVREASSGGGSNSGASSGRWVRRGSSIVIHLG